MKVSRFFLLSFLLMYLLLGFTISSVEGIEGEVLVKRPPLGGFYALGSVGNENVGELSSEVALVDSNLTAPISIDLNADRYHNIGIWVSQDNSVDRLFLYVNRDISGDATLAAAGNWRAYKSDFNQDNTWTPVTIQSVNIAAFDPANNVYRYEIELTSEQKATYFKAVNMEISDVPNLLVTEIEAYGIEILRNIDIKPGGDSNSINPRSKGIITVAILSTDTFDATQVDISTLAFGPDGAAIAHIGHFEDIDNDGDFDLVTHFRTQETGITCGDTSARLIGETRDGQTIIGIDAIKTVGCNRQSDLVEVLNEEITLRIGEITLLENSNVILDSIVVYDASHTIIYQRDLDYRLVESGSLVEIICVLGGAIDNTLPGAACTTGSPVLVDYTYIR